MNGRSCRGRDWAALEIPLALRDWGAGLTSLSAKILAAQQMPVDATGALDWGRWDLLGSGNAGALGSGNAAPVPCCWDLLPRPCSVTPSSLSQLS